jgi:hypothetical protein
MGEEFKKSLRGIDSEKSANEPGEMTLIHQRNRQWSALVVAGNEIYGKSAGFCRNLLRILGAMGAGNCDFREISLPREGDCD